MGDEDIIAAPGTPLGEAAIGIIRLSGEGCLELVDGIFQGKGKYRRFADIPPRRLTLGRVLDEGGRPLDEVLVCPMPAPHTYTRQDMVEIYCHGGVLAVREVLELVLRKGARLAGRGEFTKRAFLSGRIDIAQAEAVLDIIRSRSRQGLQAALKQLSGELSGIISSIRVELRNLLVRVEAELDFPEEVEAEDDCLIAGKLKNLIGRINHLLELAGKGKIYREGLGTALIGKPNVGKSTLLNRLLGEERAIVTDIPGTTRDIIEELVNLGGITIRLMDTAGIREEAGEVERLGIRRTREAVARADLVLALFDHTTPWSQADQLVLEIIKGKPAVLIINKVDLPGGKLDRSQLEKRARGRPLIEISAKNGRGLDKMQDAIIRLVGLQGINPEDVLITRSRHKQALEATRQSLEDALRGLEAGVTADCLAVDLWDAWEKLGEITGDTVSEEIIDRIFEDFCVGK